MVDVIIIGGGIIGLTTAWELAGRGLRVRVLDQQQPGREASWAGAGILPPGHPGEPQHPLARLCRATHPLWPELSRQLADETGIDNGFRQCGGLCFSPDGDPASLEQEMAAWRSTGARVEPLFDLEQQHALEPSLGTVAGPGYRLVDTWQVRNPRHLKALLASCQLRGVEIQSFQQVIDIESDADRTMAVRTMTDRHTAGAFLIATGAWSQRLLGQLHCCRYVEPVRGQMLLLATPAPLVRHVIECGPRYLVPRPDGRTLVGSTEEWVGFEKCNTPTAMRDLMNFAVRMIPGLAEACFEQAWSGLRPHAVDDCPILGRVGQSQNLFVATGHFRGGLHLSPITARLMAQMITGEPTDIDVTSLSPEGNCPA